MRDRMRGESADRSATARGGVAEISSKKLSVTGLNTKHKPLERGFEVVDTAAGIVDQGDQF